MWPLHGWMFHVLCTYIWRAGVRGKQQGLDIAPLVCEAIIYDQPTPTQVQPDPSMNQYIKLRETVTQQWLDADSEYLYIRVIRVCRVVGFRHHGLNLRKYHRFLRWVRFSYGAV